MRTHTSKSVIFALALLLPSTLAAQDKPKDDPKARMIEARQKADAAMKDAKAAVDAAEAKMQAAREKMRAAVEQSRTGSEDAAKAMREEAQKAMKEASEAVRKAREQAQQQAKAAMEQAREGMEQSREQVREQMQSAREEVRTKMEEAHAAMRGAIGAGDRGAIMKHTRRKLFLSMRPHVERPEDIPSAVRDELRTHARRMARLTRAREVAIEVKNDEAKTRSQQLMAREMVRHRQQLIALWQQHQQEREKQNEPEKTEPEKTDDQGAKP